MATTLARRGCGWFLQATQASLRAQPVAGPAVASCRWVCDAKPIPPPDDAPKTYPEKLTKIADQISQLTLLETADLTELLKEKLNIQNVPMMAAAPGPAAAAPAEEAPKVEEQTEFTVKLVGFKDDSKIKLIKEIKAQIEGLNLVQARKFIEGIPTVLKEGISKADTEALKTAIEAAGGQVKIE